MIKLFDLYNIFTGSPTIEPLKKPLYSGKKMDYYTEITNIIEQLPSNCSRIAIKLGKRKDQLKHIANIQAPFLDIDLIDVMDNNGFGTTMQYGRLWFYDTDNKRITTRLINQMLDTDLDKPTDISAMVDGVLMTMAEMRRFISVQNESISNLVNRNSDMVQTLFEAKEETMVERTSTIAMDLELQHFQASQDNDYKSKAAQALTDLATTAIEHYSNKITPDQIINLILANPTIIDQALENEEITKLITQKYTNKVLQQ